MRNSVYITVLLLLCSLTPLLAYNISGIVIDTATGTTLDQCQIRVNDSILELKQGEFSFETDTEGMYRIHVHCDGYRELVKTVYIKKEGEAFQFFTLSPQPRGAKNNTKPVETYDREEVAGIPWKIQCSIIDTKYGLNILFPGWAEVTHNNNKPYKIYNREFLIETNMKGTHTLHIEIPGYHPITEVFICSENNREISLMLETTDTSSTVKRRQMVISGKRGTLHERIQPGKKSFSRKELSETAGTFDDPIRSLQTLPSVSTASDASAQLSVRGGDVLESRYFVDGIPLLQPFHYGGAVSIFNEKAIHGLNFYNSGYPAAMHNAQSSIIDVISRKPYMEEDNSQFIHINTLKYNFFRLQKSQKGNQGFTVSANGIWLPLLFKPISRLVQRIASDSYDPYTRTLFNPVEYHSLSFGYGKEINPKWKFNTNNIFNFDKFSYIEIDSPAVVEYTYPDGSKLKKQFKNSWNEDDSIELNPPKPGFIDYDIVERVKVADTSFHFKQYFNVLYGTADYTHNSENNLKLSAAYQTKWYDVKFPRYVNFKGDSSELYKYDVTSNLINLSGIWINNSHKKHIISTGLQMDMNFFKYDVNIMRPWHEVITRGNTNFGDMLGPFANDTGKTFLLEEKYLNDFRELRERVEVRYKGKKENLQGACFIADEINFDDNKQLNLGLRIEGSTLDRALTFSPRIHYKRTLSEQNSYRLSTGLYTQNNYYPDVIALTEKLSPEKCIHAGVGYSHLFRNWLQVDADLYGKYYYDLSVELMNLNQDTSNFDDEDLTLDSGFVANSYYKNDGIGYAYGGELYVKYDPADFLFGWFSLSYGHSYRQRQKDWRWHAMPLERPFQFSWTHYYKLPRKYTVSCSYKITSGLPYTDLGFSSNPDAFTVGPCNEKRYDFYKRFDIRLTRAFHKKNRKTEVYLDYINIFNRPNAFLLDKEDKTIKSMALNAPFAAFTWGINMEF